VNIINLVAKKSSLLQKINTKGSHTALQFYFVF